MEPARKHNPDIEPEVRPNLRVIKGGGESTPERGQLTSTPNLEETANDLSDQERRFGLIQGGGESTPERANLKAVPDNISPVRETEESGGWQTNISGNRRQEVALTLKGWLKKRGPLGVIAALLLGAGGGLGFFGLTLMPTTIAEHFQNDLNDLNASQQRKTVHIIGGKLGGDIRQKFSICNQVVSIRCKFKTLTPEMAKTFEEKGFKLGEKTDTNGRVAFTSLEFPDGTVVRSVEELNALLRNSVVANVALSGVYSIKNGIFVLGNFFKNALAKLKLSKVKKIEGSTDEEAKKSYEASVKGEKGTISTSATPDRPGDNATDEQKNNSQAANDAGNETSRAINEAIGKGQKIKALSIKVSNALAIPQLACLAYNMANYISISAKTIIAARFAQFAMIFLTLASTIKSGTNTSSEIKQGTDILAPSSFPEKIEDPDTGELVTNPHINKNALDAEAYKVVAYGDKTNLSKFARKFFIGGGALGVLQGIVDWLNEVIGRQNIRTTCKVVNSTAAAVVGFLAAPVFSAVIFGLTQILPVEEIAAAIVNQAIDAVAGADLTTNITGVDAGNAIFVGAATILGTASAKFGLKPGALAAIKANMADNHEYIERDIAMEKYLASKTPLDITNRYSFLGSLAFQIANIMPANGTTAGAAVKILSAFPKSISMITTNANAAYSMPVADYSETRFSQCKDDAYVSLGNVSPDMFCALRFVPFAPVDPDTVLNYMEGKAVAATTTPQLAKYKVSLAATGPQINTAGNPLPGSHLEKYTKFCAERTDPWGSSSLSLEEEASNVDTDWYTGKNCMADTVENQMASEYIGYHHVQKTVDNEKDPTATTQPGTGPIGGNSRDLARQIANRGSDIELPPATKTSLLAYADTGTAVNSCGQTYTLDADFLGTVLRLADKYRIKVNNIGFNTDRNPCFPADQHTAGKAIDINGIEIKGGGKTNWGFITYTPEEITIINSYAVDWLKTLAPNRGGVGQLGCLNGRYPSSGGFRITPPEGLTQINGNLQFEDSCDHLHIDARNR